MAKLLRVHLVGVGHHEARFHPLSLRFDRAGLPLDAVVNLRNGGGKTSLLSLIYAVLLPGKVDFLGKVNESNRTLDEYFNVGRLGVVAVELENHVCRFTLLLCWVRRDRDEPPTLHSFLSGRDGIAFDDLPLQGLAERPVTSLGELEAWLRQRHSRAPAQVDLFSAPNFRDWHTHLRKSRGVDPHLFRTHLAMNRSEGAVDEEFKFTRTNDFIRRYLEFAIEAPSMGRDAEDPITASLNEHRLALLKLPHYRKELEFIAEALPLLQELASLAGRKQTADRERTDAMTELVALAAGALFLQQRYQAEFGHRRTEVENLKTENGQLTTRRDNARRYAPGYERRTRELQIEEAQRALVGAKQRLAKADIQHREYVSATLWREVRRSQAKLRAAVDERERLQQALRPERERVEQKALRLQSAFADAIAAAQLAEEQATGEMVAKTNDRLKLAREFDALQLAYNKLEAELAAIKRSLDSANRARDHLLEKEILRPRESAEDAQARLEAELFRFEAIAKTKRREAEKARERAKTHRSAQAVAQQQANLAQQAVDRLVGAIADFERQRDTCAALPEVTDILEGGAFDPANPGIVAALRGRALGLRQQELSLRVDHAEDHRILERYQRQPQGLFPPPREVESILATLRERGVRGVMSAYEWLNANFPREQATEKLRAAPATFSGLIANTTADLEAARAAVSQAQVSRPVQVTLSSALRSDPNTAIHTIIPERAGFYSANAAGAEIGRISEEQAARTQREQQLAADAVRFGDAAAVVEQFQSKFPAGWVEQQVTALADQRSLLRQYEIAVESCRTDASREEDAGAQLSDEALDFAGRAATTREKLASVQTFWNSFGQHLEDWLEQQAAKTSAQAENQVKQSDLSASIRQIDLELPALESRIKDADRLAFQLATKRSGLKLDRYLPDPLPSGVEHDDIAAEEEPFNLAREAYESQLGQDRLDADIRAAEATIRNADEAYQRQAAGLDAATIQALSVLPDLEIQQELAASESAAARVAEGKAEGDLQRAEQNRPKPLGINERADLDPSLPAAETADQAAHYRDAKQTEAQELTRELEQAREKQSLLENEMREAKSNADAYDALSDLLQPAKAEEPREHTGLTGSHEGDRERIRQVKSRFERARLAVEGFAEKIDSLYDNRIEKLVNHEKWDSFAVEIRDRLRRFNRKGFEIGATQHVADCWERQAGLQAKAAEIEDVREALIDKLYDRANDAIRALEHAARLSRLPDGLGAWSGQAFLTVTVPQRGNQAERRVLLGRLIDSWMAPSRKDMSIPRGAALAFDCLIAVMNQREIQIDILKPEAGDPTTCNYQPVTKLASFSGGQRVTAAILLYCVVVRVRSDQGSTVSDCGFLILDNPFGKASHFPLVEIQLRMARAMGVQLIYMTGINDFEALASFPLQIRLRNGVRGGNGENFVRPEPTTVEAVRVGQIADHGNDSHS